MLTEGTDVTHLNPLDLAGGQLDQHQQVADRWVSHLSKRPWTIQNNPNNEEYAMEGMLCFQKNTNCFEGWIFFVEVKCMQAKLWLRPYPPRLLRTLGKKSQEVMDQQSILSLACSNLRLLRVTPWQCQQHHRTSSKSSHANADLSISSASQRWTAVPRNLKVANSSTKCSPGFVHQDQGQKKEPSSLDKITAQEKTCFQM